MALAITEIDPATGRVIPKGTNVLIPKENAGIGDLVYKRTDVFYNAFYNSDPSLFRIVGRGTANSAEIDYGISTFRLYGVIYGFVAGMAMVAAPGETSAYWAASGVSCTVGSEYGGNTPLMRNGRKHTYAQMNTAQNANYIKGGSPPAPVTLASAYQATSLTGDSDFNALAAASEIKNKYGSWTEYIRQTLRVNGAPGTPFGATYTDNGNVVKVHEFGRWMTRKVYTTLTPANFPAIKYCYEYGEGGGVWWLPSMFELAELMIDEHLTLVRQNAGIITDVSPGSDRWSCVRVSSGYAWFYYNNGMSHNNGFSNYQLTVRPVTLLKLV